MEREREKRSEKCSSGERRKINMPNRREE